MWCGKTWTHSTRLLGKTDCKPRVARPDNVQEVLEQPESVCQLILSCCDLKFDSEFGDWVFEISRTLTPTVKTICSENGYLEEAYVWLDSACYDHVCLQMIAGFFETLSFLAEQTSELPNNSNADSV